MTTPSEGEKSATRAGAFIGGLIGVMGMGVVIAVPNPVPDYFKGFVGLGFILGGVILGAFIGLSMAEGKSPPTETTVYNPVDSDRL